MSSETGGLSRRSFLKGSGVAAVAATTFSGSAEAEPAGPPTFGPGAVTITLAVNGTLHSLAVEPGMTLAEVLRGPLGLTGTKIGCDRGTCSACTVWLAGAPVLACSMLAIDVGDRPVTTIEGLAENGVLHPVQTAFVDRDALQCGFCTPGMVMSCAALVEQIPQPTAEQVITAISGHLCRCGTYPKVIAATLAAAERRIPR